MNIQLTKVYNPFNRYDKDIAEMTFVGSTVAELVSAVDNLPIVAENPEHLGFKVSVNGVLVPFEVMHETQLRNGDNVVMMPVLHGGNGGTWKTILRFVVAIIATIVALYARGNEQWAAYAWAWALSSWVSAIGGMIVDLTAKTPDRPRATSLGYQGFDQSNSYSWNPQNTQQQGIVIPRWYGTNRINGNIVSTFIESSGSQQYLNAIVALGIGRLKNLYGFMFNRNNYENLKGVTITTRLGDLNQVVIPNFNDTKLEYPQQYKVVKDSPVIFTTTGDSFDKLEIDVSFPNGIYSVNQTTGAIEGYSVVYAVWIKAHTATNWLCLTKTPYQYRTSAGGYWSGGVYDYCLTIVGYQAGTGDSGEPVQYPIYEYVYHWHEYTSTSDINAHYEGETGIVDVYVSDEFSGRTVSYNVTWRWIGSPIVMVDALHDYKIAYAASQSPVRITIPTGTLTRGKWDVKVENFSVDQTTSSYSDDMYLTSVREVIYDDFQYPRLACVGIRALATDQISGSFSFACMTDGMIIRVWDGATWTVEASNNPAWVTYDILTQPIFDNSLNVIEYRGFDPSRLDLTKWLEWANFCDDLVPDGKGGTEKRLTFNGGFDSAMNLWDAALSVCKIGRAFLIWNGIHLTVAVEKPESPSQLFTVGNIGIDSFEETFLPLTDRATEIEIDFINSEHGYIRDKITIVDPSNTSAVTSKTSIHLLGCTKASEAWRAGMYYLNSNRYLTRVCTFSVDIDALAVTVGDVINVQHDVPQWGEGGRIVAATTTEVTLDREVTVAVGTTYSVMIRNDDDSISERTITNTEGTYTVLTVGTPFASAPSVYSPYVFGETNLLVKPFRVMAIEPDTDNKRKLTCTEYNASIYGSDSMMPVLPTANYSIVEPETITGLTAVESMIKNPGGNIDTILTVVWNPPTSKLTKNVEVFYSTTSGNKYAGLFDPGTTTTQIIVQDGVNVTVWARVVGWMGDVQGLSKAATVSVYVIGKTAPPADITEIWATPNISGAIALEWSEVTDIDVFGYVIRYSVLTTGATWLNAIEIARTSKPNYTINAAVTGTYLIKAIDTTGNLSVNEITETVSTVKTMIGQSLHSLIVEHPTWAGTKSPYMVVDGSKLVFNPDSTHPIASGSYIATGEIDFGEVRTVRITPQLVFEIIGLYDKIDDITDIDAMPSIDYSVANGLVSLSILTSQDSTAPTSQSRKALFSGDYTFQRAVFQVNVRRGNADTRIEISEFSISVHTHHPVITF